MRGGVMGSQVAENVKTGLLRRSLPPNEPPTGTAYTHRPGRPGVGGHSWAGAGVQPFSSAGKWDTWRIVVSMVLCP